MTEVEEVGVHVRGQNNSNSRSLRDDNQKNRQRQSNSNDESIGNGVNIKRSAGFSKKTDPLGRASRRW